MRLIAAALTAALALLPVRATPATSAARVEAVDVTRLGAVGDGVADDTAAFRAAAATGKPITVPRPRAHYRLTGTVSLRASLLGVGLPEIRMYGADGSRARAMFEIVGYTGPGLVVKGLRLNGQWDGGTKGEHSHAIAVKGSASVTIEGNVLERPYGDGVYVGSAGSPRPSVGVVIRDNQIVDPRRCAVAVVAGEKVRIERNRIRKSSPYVAAIDLEPNPNEGEWIDGVVIAANEFDVPGGIAVLLYSFKQNPSVNRNVTVASNVARARQFLDKPDGTGSWEALRIASNTFHADPQGPRTEQVSFVRIETSGPSRTSDVLVEENTISGELRVGQTYRDSFRGIRGLRVRGNRWTGPAKPRVTVTDSADAVVQALPSAR